MDVPGFKRKRSSQSIAAAIGAKIASKYPYSSYGRAYHKRGTTTNLSRYGPTYKEATAFQKATRKADGYVGRGSYIGKWAKKHHIGRTLRKYGRGAANEVLDAALGQGSYSTGGMFTGHGMYTGRGSYAAADAIDNSLVNNPTLKDVPSFASSGDETGSLTVSHREYVTDIYGPTNSFNVQSYSLNPGLEATFKWLSQIAQNYEEYEFKQLIFTFRSTTSDIGNSTSGQVGTVIMATNYNASSAPFGDKAVMMEYDGAMSAKVTDDMRHGVECHPAKISGNSGKYIRTNPVVQNQDIKSYDQGLFQLALANSPSNFANNPLGELWVSYTVVLRKPKLFTGRGLGISRDLFVSNGDQNLSYPLGLNTYLSGQQNNIGCSIVQFGSNIPVTHNNNLGADMPTSDDTPTVASITDGNLGIVFPSGYSGVVKVTWQFQGAGSFLGNGAGPGIITYGNVTPYTDMYGGILDSDPAPSSVIWACQSVAGIYVAHLRVDIAVGGFNNAVQLVRFQTGGTNYVQTEVEISEINSSFSYKFNNIGASDVPILVNQSGIVTVPV